MKINEKTGLVAVLLLKAYSGNTRGEIAGFEPDIARQLLDKKWATEDLDASVKPVQKAGVAVDETNKIDVEAAVTAAVAKANETKQAEIDAAVAKAKAEFETSQSGNKR